METLKGCWGNTGVTIINNSNPPLPKKTTTQDYCICNNNIIIINIIIYAMIANVTSLLNQIILMAFASPTIGLSVVNKWMKSYFFKAK